MWILRTITILAVIITTYCVESQSDTGHQANPPTVSDIASVNAVTPEAQHKDVQPPSVKKVVKAPRRRPPKRRRRPPLKRRQRKRRPPPKTSAAKGNGGKVTPPVADIIIAVKSPPKAEVVAVVEKPYAGDGFDGDFLFFGETTTTTAPPLVPPPGFSVNKGHTKKMIPKVDTQNAVAYDGTPCNETYQTHDTDTTKYMMKYAEGVWEARDCPPNMSTGLVWRQDLCACGEELVAVDPNDWCAGMGFYNHHENKHKYVRKHYGVNAAMDCAASLVWSQEKCLCIFDPTVKARPIENQVMFVCKTILQMKFEGSLKNTAEGYHIQTVNLRRRGKLPRIRYRKVPGSTDKAAMIVSQPMEFLAFRGNDFQKQVTYSLNFKISPRHEKKNTFMVLITDKCIGNPGGQNRARKPSISLAFQPNTKTFHLQFRTEKTAVDAMVKGALSDTYGWYKVVVYFEDSSINIEVNGKKLFSKTNVPGKIPQNKCPLYIAGRGPGFDRSKDFYGYLDNVYLVKDCKFHEANIKFL